VGQSSPKIWAMFYFRKICPKETIAQQAKFHPGSDLLQHCCGNFAIKSL
jgi:hypothetical protein